MSQPVAKVRSIMPRVRRPVAAALGAVAAAMLLTMMLGMMLAPSAFAASTGTPQVTMQIEAGYGGLVPAGGDMPVQVNVTNSGPDLTATLVLTSGPQTSPSIGGGSFSAPIPIPAMLKGGPSGVFVTPALPFGGSFMTGSSGAPVTWREQVQLPSGTTKHFEGYLPSSAGAVSAEVIAVSGPRKGKTLATVQTTPTATSGGLSILVISGDSSAITELGSVQMSEFSGQQGVVRVAPANLPDSPAALSPFSLVIVDNATTDGLTASQKAALESYVGSGGNLAVSGGDAWHQTLAGIPADLLAMTPTGTQTLPGLTSSASELGVAALTSSLDVASGTVPSGAVVDLAEGAAPILVEAAHGAGRIFYLTPDPDTAPVASWPGTLTLLRQLMTRATSGASTDSVLNPAASIDLQGGSIYQALANIPSLELPSPALIAVILAVFILLVGPVNYLVLHRLRRPDLAWVTIPLLVAISAGAIYGFGLAQKGTNVLADRVRVISLQPGSSTAFVSSGIGVFSPHAGNHTVSTSSGSDVAPLSSYLTEGSNAGSTGQGSEPITISAGPPATVLMNWAKADSIETFGESYDQQMSGGLSEHVAVVNGRLQGTITNTLTETIDDAVAVSGSSYQRFGELRPGASATVNLPLPSTAVVTATASSLANQIYLHTPATCPATGACNTTAAFENPGARPTASQRQAERRAQVLNGILGDGPYDATQPIFVGWAETPAGPVLVDGHAAGLDELDAFVLPLQPAISGGTLPIGAIPARIVDGSQDNGVGYYGGAVGVPFLPGGAALTEEFALPSSSWASLALTMTKSSQPSPIPLPPGGSATPSAAIYNFQTAKWDSISLSFTASVPVPSIGQHVSSSGLLLVRLTGSNSGMTLQPQLDVSGQEAGGA